MELDNQELQEMHDYLAGKMSKDQRKDYEAKLEDNLELKKEVAIQRDLKEGLLFLDLKEKYKNIHNEVKEKGYLNSEPETPIEVPIKKLPVEDRKSDEKVKAPLIIIFFKRYAVACCLFIALGLGWLGFSRYQANQQNQLAFQESFSLQPKAGTALSSETDLLGGSSEKQAADSVTVMNAVNNLAKGEVSQTISVLAKFPADGSYWNQVAQWYLALAYLKNNDRQEAKSTLEDVVKGDLYQNEARKILEDLK